MKRHFFAACVIVISATSFNATAQHWTSAGGNNIKTDPTFSIDKVGIGMTPTEKLSVNGDIGTQGNIMYNWTSDNNYRNLWGKSYDYGLALLAHDTWQTGSGILLNGEGNTVNTPGAIDFVATDIQSSPTESAFTFWRTDNTGAWTEELLKISKDGQVTIGGAAYVTPHDYKLYVQTGILTEKLKVATVGGGQWSDFVFADDYELKSLNEVEQFISKNKHLPDVPSANEVEKAGYDVTTMDATLLQKIEELTLYVIQQQKEIEALKSNANK